jgi:hypothetical protein
MEFNTYANLGCSGVGIASEKNCINAKNGVWWMMNWVLDTLLPYELRWSGWGMAMQ